MSTLLCTTWNSNHIRLTLIGWGSDIKVRPLREDIESCARFRNADKPGTTTDFSRGSTQPRTILRQSSTTHICLSSSGCAARRARDTWGGDRPANGAGGVPTHPMKIGLDRRLRNLSIPYQLQQTRDGNRLLPGRHHTARRESLGKLRFVYIASTTEHGPTPVQKSFKAFSTKKNGATRATAEFLFV